MTLQCGHTFCQKCIQKHAQSQLHHNSAILCPLCCNDVCVEDVEALGFEPEAATKTLAVCCHHRDEQCRLAERAFRRAACKGHWKLCPECGVAIAKDGGCNQMRCRCGHIFSWKTAQPVVPCRTLHWNEAGIHAWGHTCDGCSPVATAKLAAARTGICLCAIPVVAVVGAASSVPAVVFAPLAAVCEPLHMLKVCKTNPFKEAMLNGPLMVAGCCVLACEAAGILTVEDHSD